MDIFLFIAEVKNATLEKSWSHSASVIFLSKYQVCATLMTIITLFKDNVLSQFYFPGLFSLVHIHTWWGQSKYVRKFEISRANFEKTQNLLILKNFLWILCNNIQILAILRNLSINPLRIYKKSQNWSKDLGIKPD